MARSRLIIVILCLATFSSYWQVKDHKFVDADDPLYITENVHVRGGITNDNILWAFTSGYAANWHPLTWLSHMLDYQLFGLDPAGHHLVSVFLHLVNTVLLFLIFVRMTGGVWQSAFIAAVFALHPVHVESVAWASERKDVLSTLCWILTMGAYALYVEKGRRNRYLLVLLFFALGLMAKPMLVTLPFVLLLLDYWPLRRFDATRPLDNERRFGKLGNADLPNRRSTIFRLIREKIPLFALTAISSVITYFVQQQGGAIPSWRSVPLLTRVENALVAYFRYIGKTLWPSDLAVFYPHPVSALPLWQAVGAGLLLLAISVLVIRVRKNLPYLPVGWFWFLGTLVPVIGLVQVGEQSMADRYMYVPLIGLSIIMALGTSDLMAKWQHRKIILVGGTSVFLLALAVRTFSQVSYWRDTVTLFEHATHVTTDNYVALTNVGIALQAQGKIDSAIDRYLESLRINGSYELAHYNLAVALQTRGENQKAIGHYTEAIRLKPDNASALYGLGVAYYAQGEIQRALSYYLRAVQIKPDYWQAHYSAGLAFSQEGVFDSAITHYSEAIRLNPASPDLHYSVGVVFHRMGGLERAILHYREAIRLKPAFANAHSNLGAALQRQGKYREAIAQYVEALRLKPDLVEARNNLQVALASQQQTKTP